MIRREFITLLGGAVEGNPTQLIQARVSSSDLQ
jgi:hypothetical protein